MSHRPVRRKGRDLELLIQFIEQALVGTGASVESPARVRDRHTRRLREVDVLIRHRIGSSEILIALECRDRRCKQGVRWIEELATRRTSIGADRIIAISRTAFSKEAVEKANAIGVDIRLLTNLQEADLRSWMSAKYILNIQKRYEVATATCVLETDHIPDDLEGTALGAAVFESAQGQTISFAECLDRAINQNIQPLYENVPDNGTVLQKSWTVACTPHPLWLRHKERLFKIYHIVCHGRLWIEATQVPMSQALSYGAFDGPVATIVDFPAGNKQTHVSLRFVRDERTGVVSMHLVVARVEPAASHDKVELGG